MEAQKHVQGTESGLQLLDPKVGQSRTVGVEAGDVLRDHTRLWHLGCVRAMGKALKGFKQRQAMISFMTY